MKLFFLSFQDCGQTLQFLASGMFAMFPVKRRSFDVLFEVCSALVF
jgi:hypothetical protein